MAEDNFFQRLYVSNTEPLNSLSCTLNAVFQVRCGNTFAFATAHFYPIYNLNCSA
jgi:hypothetical protein